MTGISVRGSLSSNTITFYNTNTCLYYNPPYYRLDEARHPSSQFFRQIKYYGTIFLGLYRNKRNPTPKPIPPGTPITLLSDGETHSATVENIPLIPVFGPTPLANPPYLLKFDDGTAIKQKYEELSKSMHPSTTPPT